MFWWQLRKSDHFIKEFVRTDKGIMIVFVLNSITDYIIHLG